MSDKTPTSTIAQALRNIADKGASTKGGLVKTCLYKAAARLEEQEAALDNYRLRDELDEAFRHFEECIIYSNKDPKTDHYRMMRLNELGSCLNREIKEWEERSCGCEQSKPPFPTQNSPGESRRADSYARLMEENEKLQYTLRELLNVAEAHISYPCPEIEEARALLKELEAAQ